MYLPNGCEANAITFVLPSNNRLNVDSIIETSENKLGFNRSYSKINNFSLMQSLDISSITDENLKSLANEIPQMKYMSVFSINNTLTKLRSSPPNFWSSTEVKLLSTLGIPITTTIILALIIITTYHKCFWHKQGCVCKYTGPSASPPDRKHINLETILPPLPTNPDYISPKIIQEILKICDIESEKIWMLQTS